MSEIYEYDPYKDPLSDRTFKPVHILEAENQITLSDHDDLPEDIHSKLAMAIEHERTHRYQFDTIDHRLLNGIKHRIMHFDQSASYVERAILAFHDYPEKEMARSVGLHKALGHKGVGLTLAYVEQNGSWKAIESLDSEFRTLPDSEVLLENGLEFSDTYGAKDQARLSYGVKVDASRNLIAVRKRAAADIKGPNGEYDIIKRSAFLMEPNSLSAVQQRLVDAALNARYGLKRPDPALSQELGDTIVEPVIANDDTRERSPLLPVASSYVSLLRFDDAA